MLLLPTKCGSEESKTSLLFRAAWMIEKQKIVEVSD